MTDTVTLKIDGRSVSVSKGTNVLEAARSLGIDISYFCYHPGLSAPAVCRQCLVEVAGQTKLVPSCYTPVAENMDVLTESPKVLLARQQMLEFTLVNHPVDCPICDKAGECTLQKLFVEWDSRASRVDLDKVHKPKAVDLGPDIVLDAERCILCTRCIRVCDEVAKQHQLEMAYRGDRQVLTVAPGKRLDNPYSVNTVDVCPVGALTSKDFRFAMRVWELYTVPSVCAGCATGCNDEVQYAQGRVYRLQPRENSAVNKFWMCDEGRYTYHELYRARVAGARLLGEPAALDKAVHFAAEQLSALQRAGRADKIGVVLNAQATNEDNYVLCRAARMLGASRLYAAGRAPRPERADGILRDADMNPNTAGARAVARGQAKSMADLAADVRAGVLEALWILGDEVTLDSAALDAVAKLPLTLYQSPHETALAERATVVLPAATWAEIDGTFTNVKGMVQRIRRAVEPPGEARPHYQLIGMVAEKLGLELTYPSARAIFRELAASVPEMSGADFGRDFPPVQLRFAGSRG